MFDHKLFCGHIFEWHPHLQQNLGKTSITHLTKPKHSMETKALCQYIEMIIIHEKNLVSRIHCVNIGYMLT